MKKRFAPSDDVLGWVGLGLVLIAAIFLGKGNAPRKWDAAIVWTFAALFGLLLFGQKKRSSLRFWCFWAVCLCLHVLAMWLIFGQFLPRLVLGTLYIMPLAFIESLFLIAMYLKLESKLRRVPSAGSSKPKTLPKD